MSNTLSCLRIFKQEYKEENSMLTVGDIRNLIDKIDLIEYCINKQKSIPLKKEKHFKLFGKIEWFTYCGSCGKMVDSKQGCFCPKCGQKFY